MTVFYDVTGRYFPGTTTRDPLYPFRACFEALEADIRKEAEKRDQTEPPVYFWRCCIAGEDLRKGDRVVVDTRTGVITRIPYLYYPPSSPLFDPQQIIYDLRKELDLAKGESKLFSRTILDLQSAVCEWKARAEKAEAELKTWRAYGGGGRVRM